MEGYLEKHRDEVNSLYSFSFWGKPTEANAEMVGEGWFTTVGLIEEDVKKICCMVKRIRSMECCKGACGLRRKSGSWSCSVVEEWMHGSQKVGGSVRVVERASSRAPADFLSLIVGVMWTLGEEDWDFGVR